MNNTIKKWNINEAGIKKSLEQVIKTKDISKLTKDAYNFTMNISGFIAHYNQQGFMSEYSNVADLVRDLQNSSDVARPEYWIDDCFMKDQADYYKAKSRILQFIAALVSDLKVQTQSVLRTYTEQVASY